MFTDPTVCCNAGKTALHYAADGGHANILEYLIVDRKQDIHLEDKNGKPAINYC
jgi:ankyrin repeat protein